MANSGNEGVLRRAPAAFLVLAALTVSGLAAHAWSVHETPLVELLGGRYRLVLALLAIACGAGVLSLVRVVTSREPGALGRLLLLTVLFGAPALLLQAFLLTPPYRSLFAQVLGGLTAGTITTGFLLLGAERGRRPVLTRLALVAGTLGLVFLGIEGALRVAARVRPHPLFLSPGSRTIEQLTAFRGEPGTSWYGSPLNSDGFLDRELPGDPPRPLVALVADSFGLCPVPHRYHFSTICENELGEGEVYNMGINGVGAEVYLALLRDEALPLRPDAIVVSLFLGNDIPARAPQPEPSWLRSWTDRDQLRTYELVRRLLLRRRERVQREAAPAGTATSPLHPGRIDDLRFLDDPFLEHPPLTEETFLGIEVRRARELCTEGIDPLRTLVPILEEIVAMAGDVPLLFLLIPDELQVEDELWERVQQELGTPLDRDRPQRLLTQHFRSVGWNHLDLLPVLRSVPPLADGRKHVYHLQDTHLNRRGCEIVGKALAESLRTLLGSG